MISIALPDDKFPFIIFPNFINHRIELSFYPPHHSKLPRSIRSVVLVVWIAPNLLGFFKSNTSFRILAKSFALLIIEFESHCRSITVIPLQLMVEMEIPTDGGGIVGIRTNMKTGGKMNSSSNEGAGCLGKGGD